MAKPYIKRITPFDAGKDYQVSFSWRGNRSHANRILIYDNDTNHVVWDDMVSTYALEHTIPAHTLTNGKKWVIQVQTFDVENIPSAWSDKVLFFTFQTPDFYFKELPENHIITNSTFTASLYYYSDDWEDISKHVFYLYDASKKQLAKSDELADGDDMEYTYHGLDNQTVYFIRCVGVTANGMELDTGYVEVMVQYEDPNVYARIYATDLPSQGCVQVASNIVIIQYNGTDDFTYIDGMIDLRDKVLYYDEGFLIDGDFTVIIRGIYLWQTAEIFRMKNSEMGLSLSSHIYHDGKLRFRLMVPNGVGHYLLYSEELVFEKEDMVTVAIRRKNNVYQLQVFLEIGFSTEGNRWYGSQRPAQSLMKDYDTWIDTPGNTYMVDKKNYTTYLEDREPSEAIVNDVWYGR